MVAGRSIPRVNIRRGRIVMVMVMVAMMVTMMISIERACSSMSMSVMVLS
jgi:hypothetical protein